MITREVILTLKPGREMNALVAEHVLKKDPIYVEYVRRAPDCTWFEPSTNIRDAFRVLEEPCIMDHCQIGVYPTSFGKWVARSYMPGFEGCAVQADTAAEAICKAALLAATDGGKKL